MSRQTIATPALAALLLAALVTASMAGCGGITANKQVTPLPGRGAAGSQPGTYGGGAVGTPAPRYGSAGTPEKSVDGRQTRSQAPSADVSAKTTRLMIVRDKTLEMEVASVRKTLAKINVLTAAYGASITNSSISSDQNGGPQPLPQEQQQRPSSTQSTGPLSGTITIKVPVAKFDAFVRQVRKLGNIQAESESTEDVTQQHIDMKARLKNLRAEEAAFIRFFKAATSVREMIAIEQQLARVRGDIESLQGQVDFLEQRAALATLTLQLSEPGSVVSPPGQSWGFVEAITQAIRNFVSVINFLIMMTGAVLPLLLIGLIGFWPMRWLLRRFVLRKT